jgi:tetratricopeptide (TPR) repeat protein
LALLEDAKAKMESGNKASAGATLERALRLEPKNAMLWYRLGLLRWQQKNWQQAINLAKKSNSLAAGNYKLQSANWELIGQSNSSAGNKSAAKQAFDIAEELEQKK